MQDLTRSSPPFARESSEEWVIICLLWRISFVKTFRQPLAVIVISLLHFKRNYARSFQHNKRTKARAELLDLSLAGSQNAGLYESARKCSIPPVAHRFVMMRYLVTKLEWLMTPTCFPYARSGEQFTKAFINTNCSPRLTWRNAESFFFFFAFH